MSLMFVDKLACWLDWPTPQTVFAVVWYSVGWKSLLLQTLTPRDTGVEDRYLL